MAIIGFARVSTRDQDLTQQLLALEAAGCSKVFQGKRSGASKANEEALGEMVNFVREGDVIVVTKLDRLGRSLKAVLQTLEDLKSKGCTFRTLDGQIDTTNDSPMAHAFIQLIGVFAELERSLIVSRTSEGREAALADGVKFGRKPKLSQEQVQDIRRRLNDGQSINSMAAELSITRSAIYRVRNGASK